MKKNILDLRRYLVEIKLGVFFLIAIVLFFIAIISIREISFFKGTYLIKVRFQFVEGIKVTSPVRFCGVDVGEVKKLEIKEEKEGVIVYVYAKISKGVFIPKSSKFFINSLSMLGEKYLEIMPSAPPFKDFLKEGDTVDGVNSTPLFDIVGTISKAVDKIDNFFNEGNIRRSLEETVMNINETSREIKELIVDIRNKQGTVGRLLYDSSLYDKTEELIEDIKKNPWKLLYKPKEKRVKTK
ncbi:MAG: MlaD family protein [Candidatus Omnitrophica bacterium]|nr:MlaD family protein [Candidatus Omnitrophota bacterium]